MTDPSKHTDEPSLVTRLKHLIKANQSLAKVESLDTVIQRLLKLARNVANAEAASFMTYDPVRHVLHFTASEDEVLGERVDDILGDSFELEMGQGVAGWVAQERQPKIIPDPYDDVRFYRKVDETTGFVTRTLVAVPVLFGEELLGVIEVLNAKERECFLQSDCEILESFANLAAAAIIRDRLNQEHLRQQTLQIHMDTAAKIQALFWPKLPQLDHGSHIWGISLPASYAGGDLYDWIQQPDGSWLVYMADVTGKGLPASMVSAALWSKIRSEASLHNDIVTILEAVNHTMYHLLSEENLFATIIMGKYDPSSGVLRFANGGHLPTLLISGEKTETLPNPKALPLGVLPEITYEEQEVVIGRNQSVLFISDGVTEAVNTQGHFFGQEGIEAHIQGAEVPPCGKGLVDALKAWSAGAIASDDLTIVEIWRE